MNDIVYSFLATSLAICYTWAIVKLSALPFRIIAVLLTFGCFVLLFCLHRKEIEDDN